jgi:hypothetical protein
MENLLHMGQRGKLIMGSEATVERGGFPTWEFSIGGQPPASGGRCCIWGMISRGFT